MQNAAVNLDSFRRIYDAVGADAHTQSALALTHREFRNVVVKERFRAHGCHFLTAPPPESLWDENFMQTGVVSKITASVPDLDTVQAKYMQLLAHITEISFTETGYNSDSVFLFLNAHRNFSLNITTLTLDHYYHTTSNRLLEDLDEIASICPKVQNITINDYRHNRFDMVTTYDDFASTVKTFPWFWTTYTRESDRRLSGNSFAEELASICSRLTCLAAITLGTFVALDCCAERQDPTFSISSIFLHHLQHDGSPARYFPAECEACKNKYEASVLDAEQRLVDTVAATSPYMKSFSILSWFKTDKRTKLKTYRMA